ncbi:MAG TPA: dTDP-4-amino-4,6-dideoxygalactose transaminase [Pseudolabrys sp.]|nr:dTDP-4-amino-4,6-dideoxygalactose transaminase [Pseudolabrys sp.]
MSEAQRKIIPFSMPDIRHRERVYLEECLNSGAISGDGPFSERCHKLLTNHFGVPVLLTHSGTAALEMGALLLDVGPGDEVIMPSYTFVSTANAFVLRGATPVFIDIRPDTLNLDETQLEHALTPRTRVVVPVHYGGVGCQMDVITGFAQKNGLKVLEDAAQGYLAAWDGQPLGGIGALGAISFHATKNVVSGEGGLLVINDPKLEARARIIREKGTNRTDFSRGKVDKYEWLDIGSSYLPSDLIAAALLGQLEEAAAITDYRKALWRQYHARLADLAGQGRFRRPTIPQRAESNGHIYYLLLESPARRKQIQSLLQEAGIAAHTHYVPLHTSFAGRKFGRSVGDLPVTERVFDTMLRLPLHGRLTAEDVDRVCDLVIAAHAKPTGAQS